MSTSYAGLVSVVMPAYNAAPYIAESIESVRAQTYPYWELLIVDDGSTDNTRIIAEEYCTQDKRISYLYQANGRQGKARNNGIAHATGKYLAFLDSDDIWFPEKLHIQVAEIQKLGIDLVFTDAYLFSDSAKLNDSSYTSLARMCTKRQSFTGTEGVADFLISNQVPILTVLTKREVVLAVGGFIEKRSVQNAEDYHLWLKMLLEGYTLVGLDYVLAAYRKHSASVSNADGLNTQYAVEAKLDLATAYPKSRVAIIASIRRSLLQSLDQLAVYTKEDFYTILCRYLVLSGNSSFLPLLRSLEKLGARSLALRSTYFILNYL